MFFGGTQPDWVDLSRVQVPAADEQQRMLANLVIGMENDRMPLPRFWYLPRGLKAAVVLTGDDHNYNMGGTNGQFNRYLRRQPARLLGGPVAVRALDHLPLPGDLVTNAQAAAFQAQGFEIALHLWVSGNPPGRRPATATATTSRAPRLGDDLAAQLQVSARPTRASRAGDQPQPLHHLQRLVERARRPSSANGIRLDTNYYYWPGSWVQDRPGFFTGSGFPMRFADTDGSLIDVYQAATQLTDESGQDIADRDQASCSTTRSGRRATTASSRPTCTPTTPDSPGADAIIAAAQARGVPVVSARADAHVARRPQRLVVPGPGASAAGS